MIRKGNQSKYFKNAMKFFEKYNWEKINFEENIKLYQSLVL
jgi:hypothetical protein